MRQRSTRDVGPKRGRRGSGLTREDAAEKLGVSSVTYRKAEKDEIEVRDAQAILDITGRIRPTTGELCKLARDRSGMTIAGILAELGVSRPTYLGLENKADPRIVAYWRKKGFTFPSG